MFRKILITWLFLLISTLAQGFDMTISENQLPRDPMADGKFTFTLTITNAEQKDTLFQKPSLFEERVTAKIMVSGEGEILPIGPYSENPYNSGFYIIQVKDPNIVPNSNQKYDITFYLEVVERQTGNLYNLIKDKGTTISGSQAKKIQLEIHFKPAEGSEDSRTVDFSQIMTVANETPSDFTVTPAFKKIYFSWTQKDSISYSDGQSRASNGLMVVIIEQDMGSFEFPAKRFRSDQTSDEDTTCQFTPFTENCVVCGTGSDDNVYVKLDDLNSIPGIQTRKVSSSISSDNIDAPDINKQYAVFAMYAPDGIQTSWTSCTNAQSYINSSMTELNGEPAAQNTKSCFIATAAYGSPLDKNIDYLRWFRDKHLMTSDLGRKMVRAYYEHSPRFAAKIQDNETLKSMVRGLLWVPVKLIQGWKYLEEGVGK